MLIEVAEGTSSSIIVRYYTAIANCNHSWWQLGKAALIFALP
ncbi:hypothetical protein [Nostoc sp.]